MVIILVLDQPGKSQHGFRIGPLLLYCLMTSFLLVFRRVHGPAVTLEVIGNAAHGIVAIMQADFPIAVAVKRIVQVVDGKNWDMPKAPARNP